MPKPKRQGDAPRSERTWKRALRVEAGSGLDQAGDGGAIRRRRVAVVPSPGNTLHPPPCSIVTVPQSGKTNRTRIAFPLLRRLPSSPLAILKTQGHRAHAPNAFAPSRVPTRHLASLSTEARHAAPQARAAAHRLQITACPIPPRHLPAARAREHYASVAEPGLTLHGSGGVFGKRAQPGWLRLVALRVSVRTQN